MSTRTSSAALATVAVVAALVVAQGRIASAGSEDPGINAADPSWYWVGINYTGSSCGNSTIVPSESNYFKFSQMYPSIVANVAASGAAGTLPAAIGVCSPIVNVSFPGVTVYATMSNECLMQIYTDSMCTTPVGGTQEIWNGECKVDPDPSDASVSGIAPGTTLYTRNYCTNVAPTTIATYVDLSLVNAITGGVLTPAAPVPASGGSDVCFAAESTVEREDGTMVALKDIKVGERVLTLNAGVATFSDVVAVPHQHVGEASEALADLLAISAGGHEVEATGAHLIAAVVDREDCGALGAEAFSGSARLVEARRIAEGMCVAVRDRSGGFYSAPVSGVKAVSRRTRLLSVVTADRGYPFVNGVAASPFALNHFFPTAFYGMHRFLYAAGLVGALESGFVRGFTDAVGRLAVGAHSAVFSGP